MKYVTSADHDVIKMCNTLRNRLHVPKAWHWMGPGDMFYLISRVGEMIEETNFSWRYFGDPSHDLGWHLTCITTPTKTEIRASNRTQEQWYRDTVSIDNLEPEFYRPSAATKLLNERTH